MPWSLSGAPDQFLWEHWDEESVVYHAPSGQTHLLNALATEALLLLQSRPLGLPALTNELASLCEIQVDASFLQKIGVLTTQLQDLGLIERSSNQP